MGVCARVRPSTAWADLRVRATSASSGQVFVGVAQRRDVERYLAGVDHSELTELDFDPFRTRYDREPGARVPAPPARQPFWAARAPGDDETMAWKVAEGNWQVVAMNADGSPGVSLDASVGVRIAHLLTIGLAVAGGGLLLLVSGLVCLGFGIRACRPRVAVS